MAVKPPKEHRRVSTAGSPLSAIDKHFMDDLRNDFRTFINETLFETVNDKPGFRQARMTDGSPLSPYEQLSGIVSGIFESYALGTQVPKDAQDFKLRMNRSVREVRQALEDIDGIKPSAREQVLGIYSAFALQSCVKAHTAQLQLDTMIGRSR